MEGSSNSPLSASVRIQDLEYLYASNTNVFNFVSVKLSGNRNYLLWKAQILCLLETHNMCGIVDATFVSPRDCGMETMRRYDSLVKGWIFGSVCEDVLVDVFNLSSAKAVWEKLKSIYDPTMSLQHDSAPIKSDAYTETKDIAAVFAKTTTNGEDAILIEVTGEDRVPTETETKNEDTKKDENKKKLRKATIEGKWSKAYSILKEDKDLATEAISSDGSTILHIAVGIGHNDFVKKLFSYINDEQVLEKRNSDGSTALHIAAIVGNKHAADILVKKNSKLLQIKDHKGKEPWHKAYENMHLDTIVYLLKAGNDDGESLRSLSIGSSVHPHSNPNVARGVELLVNAISAKQYNLASDLIQRNHEFASENDDVLMAIAKTFPRGLDDWETLIYSPIENLWKSMQEDFESILWLLASTPLVMICMFSKSLRDSFEWSGMLGLGKDNSRIICVFELKVNYIYLIFFRFAREAFGSLLGLVFFPILVVYYSLLVLYFLCWKVAKILVAPINNIEKKMKEWEDAVKVLQLVCDEIDNLRFVGTHHPYYTRPILEAACQNAYKVVDEILFRSPEAIQSTNEGGYDIIQLAILHRSEKIYNLIYHIGERKNLYRTKVDSSKNNVLHLAGKLAPSSELSRRTGAALQLQRELQWCEEVKKLLVPTYNTRENIFKETPDMVFTREHKKLVKEGEQWMKTTAESCSITAALITTIVFAAAITVPGGNQEKTGIPHFREQGAFTVFAVSDAISLFASSTALLVFLSILTARFAEKDFLVSLPRRLLIGLFSLLLSTTAMMTAFSATLYLVFCDNKRWMTAPICGLAFIPIAFFVTQHFPLMVDLFQSTHLRIFGKQRKSVFSRFNPDDIRLRFVK